MGNRNEKDGNVSGKGWTSVSGEFQWIQQLLYGTYTCILQHQKYVGWIPHKKGYLESESVLVFPLKVSVSSGEGLLKFKFGSAQILQLRIRTQYKSIKKQGRGGSQEEKRMRSYPRHYQHHRNNWFPGEWSNRDRPTRSYICKSIRPALCMNHDHYEYTNWDIRLK